MEVQILGRRCLGKGRVRGLGRSHRYWEMLGELASIHLDMLIGPSTICPCCWDLTPVFFCISYFVCLLESLSPCPALLPQNNTNMGHFLSSLRTQLTLCLLHTLRKQVTFLNLSGVFLSPSQRLTFSFVFALPVHQCVRLQSLIHKQWFHSFVSYLAWWYTPSSPH